MNTTTETPRIFVTDYASYNNGTQFEFGHWVDLDDFRDADELNDYITSHFAEADEKSPLGHGSIREELMITDYENFPEELYSESGMDFEALYEYMALDNDQQMAVAFILYDGHGIDYALSHYENVCMIEDCGSRTHWDLFEEYYPEAEKASNTNDYLQVDYQRFIDTEFITWKHNGNRYLINESWNH